MGSNQKKERGKILDGIKQKGIKIVLINKKVKLTNMVQKNLTRRGFIGLN